MDNDHEAVSLRLPRETIRALQEFAKTEAVSPGQLVRDILRRDLARRMQEVDAGKDLSVGQGDRIKARLTHLLVPILSEARGWDDLHDRLEAEGYALRASAGSLLIYDAESGQRLCKASELGFAYGRLVRQFNAPMPGHPQKMPNLFRDPDVEFTDPAVQVATDPTPPFATRRPGGAVV